MTGLIADIDIVEAPKSDQNCEFRTTEEGGNVSARKLYIESYGCQMNFF